MNILPMNFHPTDPRDRHFRERLDVVWPAISCDLGVVGTLPETSANQILEVILEFGCKPQCTRNIMLGRHAAVELPRSWLLPRLENTAEKILDLDDEWEYRRFLELTQEMDARLLARFVTRGLNSKNPEVVEVAGDFASHL